MRIFWALYYFLWFLPVEIIKSNVQVAIAVLFPSTHVKPAIVAVPIDLKTEWGVVLLANSITLTPGTITIDISEDRKFIYVHCLALESTASFIQCVKDDFEKKILRMEGRRI